MIGAFVFGLLWAKAYNNLFRFDQKNLFWKIIYKISFFVLTGSIPTFIRGGIEGYKGVFLDSMLIPGIILFLALRGKK